MRRPSLPKRRSRIRLPARAAAWLVAFALALQAAVGAGAALGMWMEANGARPMAQGLCAEHAAHGQQDQHSGQASHDHEHCLLCNAAVGDCPGPVLPLLSAALQESITVAAVPESVGYRKLVHANAPRGPPERT